MPESRVGASHKIIISAKISSLERTHKRRSRVKSFSQHRYRFKYNHLLLIIIIIAIIIIILINILTILTNITIQVMTWMRTSVQLLQAVVEVSISPTKMYQTGVLVNLFSSLQRCDDYDYDDHYAHDTMKLISPTKMSQTGALDNLFSSLQRYDYDYDDHCD